MQREMKCQIKSRLPTVNGTFSTFYYQESNHAQKSHLALTSGDFKSTSLDGCTNTLQKPVLVRIHSSCMTSEIFGSQRCDCAEQLKTSLRLIGEKGGILIYLNQEGRDIGLLNKLKAYNLIDEGLDTVEANLALGLPEDNRDYRIAAEILTDLGIKDIFLLTNNPKKVLAMEQYNINGIFL